MASLRRSMPAAIGVVVTVLLAWQAGALVTRSLSSNRASTISADDVGRLLDDAAGEFGSTSTTISDDGAATDTQTPTGGTDDPSTHDAGDDHGGAAGLSGGSDDDPATHDVGDDHATTPSTTPTAAPPTTTGAGQPAGSTRTYDLVGGSVGLRFEASGVTVLWANPKSGYSVSTEPETEDGFAGVKVEFESESHRSRVDGWWNGGPQDRVREEAR